MNLAYETGSWRRRRLVPLLCVTPSAVCCLAVPLFCVNVAVCRRVLPCVAAAICRRAVPVLSNTIPAADKKLHVSRFLRGYPLNRGHAYYRLGCHEDCLYRKRDTPIVYHRVYAARASVSEPHSKSAIKRNVLSQNTKQCHGGAYGENKNQPQKLKTE